MIDPGQGTAADGRLRDDELSRLATLGGRGFVVTQLVGAWTNDVADLTVSGTFEVSAVTAGGTSPLSGAKVELSWDDITVANKVAISTACDTSGAAAILQRALGVSTGQVIAGVEELARKLEQATGVGRLHEKIPLLDKTLGRTSMLV